VTLATVITLIRLALIPVFAWIAVSYGRTVDSESPDEALRWLAVAIYTLASVLDGLDGWIARHFDQKSLAGAILDPLTDKALLMTGLITATFVNWGIDWHLPVWFIILVIARDLEIIGGIWILFFINKRVPIAPHWTGKVCTVLQMIAMGWIMLRFTAIDLIYPTIAATIFTIWSGYEYYMMGYRQLPGKLRS
jgi:CDP-diacylglycerol--glycerol-3-phosphate 3-phosphatidyltransferase|tara:strand:- start:1449 stop:2027 length:579 start_codon:yes stop_codon:yes gene_type:complete